MPEAAAPKMELWIPKLAEMIGLPDDELVLIGHSMGVQTIMRYLASINTQIARFISVAGFFTLIPGSIGTAEDEKVADPWLTIPIDTEKVKSNTQKITAIFSDDDPYIALENVKMFEKRLGAKTVVLHNKGHMGASENVTELPEALKAILTP